MERRLRQMVASLAVGAVVGCSSSPARRAPDPPPTATVSVDQDASAFYVPPSPLRPGPPGSLVRAEIVTGVAGVPSGATVWRVLYRSRSIYDADIAVSGYVVVPPGPAPVGGWNILSWAHGTTGITPACFPSLLNTGGRGRPYLAPDLAVFLGAGYVVAATDYEGLGGLEPYLLGESEGRGVLDAARVARNLPGVPVSSTTLIYGHSQGGHAALFAGELAPAYAPDLRVVGVAAAAPATNLSLIMGVAATPAAQGALPLLIEVGWSWTQTYRDLPATVFFTPEGVQLAPTLTAKCVGDTAKEAASRHLQNSQIVNGDLASNRVAVAHARLNDPGRVHTSTAILVVQGTADGTVPPALTDAYVQKMACPAGDTIEYLRVTGATHGSIPMDAAGAVRSWMSDRLAGRSAPSTCGLPDDARSVAPAS